MIIPFNFSALKKTRRYECAVRFVLGGAKTVIAGMLATRYGPVFGGLFLAFPPIFPASATLIEKHENERKQRAGIMQTVRGQQAAALDACGAAMGSVGLAGFAFAVWKLAPIWNGPLTLLTALVVWLILAIVIWRARRHRLFLLFPAR
jgi:uncharacterized protein DUF3147